MKPLVSLTVKKSFQGKFGPQLLMTDGEYYSFGKFYKGITSFDPGTSLELDVFVGSTGNKYINSLQVLGTDTKEAPTSVKAKKAILSVEPSTPKTRDFDLENYGKVKSLFVEAVMPMLVNPTMKRDEIRKEIRDWALWVFVDDRKA